MRPFPVGDILVSSFIERDGPWRAPTVMFPTADKHVAHTHLSKMPSEVYDAVQDLLVITYQTFVVRTPKHNILIDTCVGENKPLRGAALNYPKQPWLDGFAAHGIRFEDIDYVFCTHLHVEHCGGNTKLLTESGYQLFQMRPIYSEKSNMRRGKRPHMRQSEMTPDRQFGKIAASQ